MAISVPSEQQGNVPPHNIEAETSVLGSILMSEQALDVVQIDVRLHPQDFYRQRHRLIFGSMLRLKNMSEPQPVDVLTVCDDLSRAGELEEAGGEAYIHSLPSIVPVPGNHRNYAKIVKEHAMLRRLLDAARKVQEEVLSFKAQPTELVERAEAALFRIAHEDKTGELRTIEAILHDELDKLELVSREGISLTGTPSGFKDIDELTGGFQPGNLIVLAARPAMGKCLPGSALIYDPTTGARRRMDEVVAGIERGEETWVAALGSDLKLRPAKATAAFRNGRRPIYRLKTRLGRTVEATANHPLFTMAGWREIEGLAPGDRIAVPRKLPRSGARSRMDDRDIVLLAALIADGNLTQQTPRFCFGEGSAVKVEVERAAEAYGLRLRVGEKSRGTATISAGRGAPSNPVRERCQRHGQWGKGSGHKYVPTAIFGLDDDQVARFLTILYGCDGHVHVTDRLGQIGYTTISERLARDVQHLLLRLGIVSKIRVLKRPVYEGTDKVAREVLITDQASLARFCELIPVCGKGDRIQALVDRALNMGRHSNKDTVPAEVWERITAVRGQRPLAELSVATGRSPNHNWHVGSRGLSRARLGEIAEWSQDPELQAFASSDVWWDEIDSIELVGEDETFDITVPGDHNFVANDVCVHNSALVTNMAENASVDHGRAVALFSLEMSETELAQRFIASQAKLNGDDLRKGRVKPDRWPKVVKATEKLASAPLFVDDSSDIGVMEMRAKARRLHARNPLGLIIVDYLQLLRPEDSSVSRVEQVGQMSRGLKLLARELNVPVIAVSQLSRAVESRPDKRPLLSDLRESGNVEQDADVVMFIYRDEYYQKDKSEHPGEAEVIIAKHRNGPVGDVHLAFISRHPKFGNLYREPGGGADLPPGLDGGV